MCYLHGDKSVPIFSRRTHYNYSEAIEILLSKHKDRVCVKHPIAVEENASFLVDLDKLDHVDDIKSDDCGHWKHNGRKTIKVAVWSTKSKISVVSTSKKAKSPPDENSRLYTLSRVYYVNDPHDDFKRTYYYLYGKYCHLLTYILCQYFLDKKRIRCNLCLVCYGFDGTPHPINPRPHGNSKGEQAYVRTLKSTKEKLSASTTHSIKGTMMEVIGDVGGIINTRSAGALPRNSQQVAYYKSKEKSSRDTSDVLYNVMLQCKSCVPGKEFVRSVVAAPEPMAILASNQQLDDMVRFLTNPIEFAIMGVDQTFNFGEFNVTPIVYRNLLLEHRTKGHSPVMLGPMLVHQQKKFSSYNFFASSLISLRPALRNILAFGTDGEAELHKALSTNFPNAIHLRCFRHYRANLSSKLKELAIPSTVTDEFLMDVFGKTEDGIHTEGLVDAESSSAFEEKLEELQDIWDEREQGCNPGKTPAFFDWFITNKAKEIVSNMLRPIREAAGLGCQPSPYYTNDSECINSVMHGKTEYKASQWDEFNISMQELVKQSYQLLELAVLDRGVARFRPMYKHLILDQLKWTKMTPKQRELHLHKVATTKVAGSLSCTENDEMSLIDSTDYG